MKRSELRSKYRSSLAGLNGLVTSAPQRAAIVAFVLGIFVALLPRLFVPVVIVAGVLALAVWFLAEPDEDVDAQEGTSPEGRDAKPVNGSAGRKEQHPS